MCLQITRYQKLIILIGSCQTPIRALFNSWERWIKRYIYDLIIYPMKDGFGSKKEKRQLLCPDELIDIGASHVKDSFLVRILWCAWKHLALIHLDVLDCYRFFEGAPSGSSSRILNVAIVDGCCRIFSSFSEDSFVLFKWFLTML